MDGPVVTAARRAIEARDVRVVLPYVKKSGEAEVIEAFDRSLLARDANPAANELADLYFFDTVVRVHRAGEGAPHTGLKPAGLPVGPVIPVAEHAIEAGDVTELLDLLAGKLAEEVEHRFARMQALRAHADEGVDAARDYVEALLGLEVWSNRVFECLAGPAHEASEGGGHEH